MAKISLRLWIWLCINFLFPADCVRIEFYQNGDFTGLYHESDSTLKCNNFPENKSPFVKSIRTDTCLMIYLDRNCRSPYSWKIMPPEVSDGEYRLGSFHICNDVEGGSQLNIDITGYYDIWNPTESPRILESYQNVCGCVNVPKYIQLLDEWSVNNHGNVLMAYFEPDCSDRKWEPKLIPAGNNLDSRKVYMHQMTDSRTNRRYGIQSFGPHKSSIYYQTSCNVVGGGTQMEDYRQVVQRSERYSEKDENEREEYCKIDNRLVKLIEDGFRKQMEAFNGLMKFIKMENSIQNVKICQQNRTQTN